jgi:hypothetical protein
MLDILWRPALYLFYSLVLGVALLMALKDPRVLVIFIPAWGNILSLSMLMTSPDFRYGWPTAAVVLCLWPLMFRSGRDDNSAKTVGGISLEESSPR